MSSILLNQNKSRSSSRASSAASEIESLARPTSLTKRHEKQVKSVVDTGLTYDTIRDRVLATMKRDKDGRVVGNASVKALLDMYTACEKEGFDTRHFVPMMYNICHLVATGAKVPELYDEVSIDNGLVVVLSDDEREVYERKRDEMIRAVVLATGLSGNNKILQYGRADKAGNKQSHSPDDFVKDVLADMEMGMTSKDHRHGPKKTHPVLLSAASKLGLKGSTYSFKALACVLKTVLKSSNVRVSISESSDPVAFRTINQNRKNKKGDAASDKKPMHTLSYTVIRHDATDSVVGALYRQLRDGQGEAFQKLRDQSAKTKEELKDTNVARKEDFVFGVVAEDRIAQALALGGDLTNMEKLTVGEFVESTRVCLKFESDKVIQDKEKQLAAKTGGVATSRPRDLLSTAPLTAPLPRSVSLNGQQASNASASNAPSNNAQSMLMGRNTLLGGRGSASSSVDSARSNSPNARRVGGK